MNYKPAFHHTKRSIAHWVASIVGSTVKQSPRLKILTFHDISDDPQDAYAISKRQFAQFLDLLQGEGYRTVRIVDIVSSWPSLIEGERVVALTFDDGHASHMNTVCDLLLQKGMTGSFFVVTSFVSKVWQKAQDTCVQCLSWDDLRQMASLGFEIGSHSHTHILLAKASAELARFEVQMSKKILERELSHAISSFAYPYGQAGAFSRGTDALLKTAGYSVGLTEEGTRIRLDADIFRLPRTCVDASDTSNRLRRKMRGSYELLQGLRRYEI